MTRPCIWAGKFQLESFSLKCRKKNFMKIHQLILIIIVCAYDNDVSGWKESTPQFRNKNKIKYAMALTSKH